MLWKCKNCTILRKFLSNRKNARQQIKQIYSILIEKLKTHLSIELTRKDRAISITVPLRFFFLSNTSYWFISRNKYTHTHTKNAIAIIESQLNEWTVTHSHANKTKKKNNVQIEINNNPNGNNNYFFSCTNIKHILIFMFYVCLKPNKKKKKRREKKKWIAGT